MFPNFFVVTLTVNLDSHFLRHLLGQVNWETIGGLQICRIRAVNNFPLVLAAPHRLLKML